MAITLTPQQLTDVTRDTTFSQTISATGNMSETIDSISISGTNIDPGITLTGATISGQYISQFNDDVYYVTKGSSDLLETPTVVTGTGNVPVNKDLIKFDTDATNFITKTYSVTVTYTEAAPPIGDGSTGSETLSITQQVDNDTDGYVTWLTTYLDENV